ncbi:MAG: phosphoglycerate kinase [Bacilli bacterium]|nr:phosphoglycerate kinase [Bacilli bacterium]
METSKKCITDFKLDNKRVIIRVDFNVPIKNKQIEDDNRIKESLETIKYAIDNNAKVILLSHLGRIKEESDLEKNNLNIVVPRLSELLSKPVKFMDATRGKEVEDTVDNMNPGDVILLQNTRYEDLDGNKESGNDPELGKYWASLGDIFINDAFGTSHRSHASNVGIASHLPNGIGFLIKKELEAMLPTIENPEEPFIIILGGAKVKDKIGVINNLVNKASNILIGGGMAYTFLKAKGYKVGNSLLDNDNMDYVNDLLENYGDKIILPIDTLTSITVDGNSDIYTKDIKDMNDTDIGVDIGPKTVELFKSYILNSKTVIWNGPMGIFEIDKFSKGTKDILTSLVGNRTVIIGGGDTSSAAINMGFAKDFTHISTGGGASLEMLAGNKLPGIEVIDEK